MEGSKELNDIFEAIDKWTNKHKGNVDFIGSFIAFKGKNFDVVDDRLIAYGLKENLKISLESLDEGLKKEKEDFVNW